MLTKSVFSPRNQNREELLRMALDSRKQNDSCIKVAQHMSAQQKSFLGAKLYPDIWTTMKTYTRLEN